MTTIAELKKLAEAAAKPTATNFYSAGPDLANACIPERIAALCDCAEALRELLDALDDRSRAYYPSPAMEERAVDALARLEGI